jgi:hypothetical protein
MAGNFGSRHRGRFESLERRNLLAGDVLVSLAAGGRLEIQGDDLDNKVLVTAGAEAGSFVVTGLDGTTVTMDGTTSGEATIQDASDVKIDLGAGNDLVAVVGANVGGKLSINTGSEDDRVFIGTAGDAVELEGVTLPADLAVTVGGRLNVKTGDGDDVIEINDASVNGMVSVYAGDGDDNVTLGGSVIGPTDGTASAEANVGLGLGLGHGHGEHGLGLGLGRLFHFGGHFRARGGADIDLGNGDDTLNLDNVTARGKISVRAGDGDDTINATAVTSAALSVLGGDGLDAVTLNALTVDHVGIHTGDDSDTVDVRDSVFTSLGISLGDGDDSLTTENLTSRVVALLGGHGYDTLNQLTDDDYVRELIRGFELPTPVNIPGLPLRGLGRLLHRAHEVVT